MEVDGRQTERLLAPRELECLRLIGDGLTDKEIAQQLDISPFTVRSHVATIFRKLHTTNRAQTVALALRLGIMK